MKALLFLLCLGLTPQVAHATEPSEDVAMIDPDATNATLNHNQASPPQTDPVIVETCARAAHEANRAWCLANGDDTQPSWEGAPEWQKSSARNGVRGVLERGNTPEESHQGWLDEKLATGWTWGPVKNPELKQHPCMVPYAELPPEQRAKDHIFTSVVRTMASAFWKPNGSTS